jgi:hypothetical protein
LLEYFSISLYFSTLCNPHSHVHFLRHLGWSAFTDFIVFIIGWPLNSYITHRSIGIEKGLLAARDERMAVLTELIGAVKFIKFFAWEERWIQKALDSRAFELKWMVKARMNVIFSYPLWASAPILVSIISFLTYVMSGQERVAFTVCPTVF